MMRILNLCLSHGFVLGFPPVEDQIPQQNQSVFCCGLPVISCPM